MFVKGGDDPGQQLREDIADPLALSGVLALLLVAFGGPLVTGLLDSLATYSELVDSFQGFLLDIVVSIKV